MTLLSHSECKWDYDAFNRLNILFTQLYHILLILVFQ